MPGRLRFSRYIYFVADKLDLRRNIQLQTRVAAAEYVEGAHRWRILTDTGEELSAKFCVMATGALSAPLDPNLPGLARFRGEIYRTHHWPHHKVEFAAKRVGLIGTGSSGVQATPIIAEEAAHLTVFQRTANFSIPLRNQTMPPEYEREWKANYAKKRTEALRMRNNGLMNQSDKPGADASAEELEEVFAQRWQMGGISYPHGFSDTARNARVNEAAADYVRRQIAKKVHDPVVAESLIPTDHPIGSKRLCADTNYYETFNRLNTTLVDLKKTPIETIDENGIRTSAGYYPLDVLVLATGFDAMTGALQRIDVKGRGGLSVRAKWDDAPTSFHVCLCESRVSRVMAVSRQVSASTWSTSFCICLTLIASMAMPTSCSMMTPPRADSLARRIISKSDWKAATGRFSISASLPRAANA